MTELSPGLWALDLQVREAYYRERARRGPVGPSAHDLPARRRTRWLRRAA